MKNSVKRANAAFLASFMTKSTRNLKETITPIFLVATGLIAFFLIIVGALDFTRLLTRYQSDQAKFKSLSGVTEGVFLANVSCDNSSLFRPCPALYLYKVDDTTYSAVYEPLYSLYSLPGSVAVHYQPDKPDRAIISQDQLIAGYAICIILISLGGSLLSYTIKTGHKFFTLKHKHSAKD